MSVCWSSGVFTRIGPLGLFAWIGLLASQHSSDCGGLFSANCEFILPLHPTVLLSAISALVCLIRSLSDGKHSAYEYVFITVLDLYQVPKVGYAKAALVTSPSNSLAPACFGVCSRTDECDMCGRVSSAVLRPSVLSCFGLIKG